VYRQLEPRWNPILIVASIAISFLGAFTSTQLMCHARMSLRFHSVLLWVLFGSFVFGGCSVWCLHMVAMLACEFDVKMGVKTPLTVLSAFLPVFFTFLALGGELLWDRWHYTRGRERRKARRKRQKTTTLSPVGKPRIGNHHTLSLRPVAEEEGDEDGVDLGQTSSGHHKMDLGLRSTRVDCHHRAPSYLLRWDHATAYGRS
jgi:hypothetical protein